MELLALQYYWYDDEQKHRKSFLQSDVSFLLNKNHSNKCSKHLTGKHMTYLCTVVHKVASDAQHVCVLSQFQKVLLEFLLVPGDLAQLQFQSL